MNDNNENLDSLIDHLYGKKEADEVREDIRRGDEYLNAFPLPEPADVVIEAVKRDVTAAVIAHRRRIHRRTAGYRIAVVAALLLIITGLGVRFMTYHRASYSGYKMAIEDVDTSGFFGADMQIALIFDEIDEIESSMFPNGIFSKSQDKSFKDIGEDVDEIETEIIEVSSFLW